MNIINVPVNKIYHNMYYHTLFKSGNLSVINPTDNEVYTILDLNPFGVHYDAYVVDSFGNEKELMITRDTYIQGYVETHNSVEV